jgi:membrane protein implicated in regulation of membrane protease activity
MFTLPSVSSSYDHRAVIESMTKYGSFRVSYRGGSWGARPADENSMDLLSPGDVVQVVGRSGITLLIEVTTKSPSS